VSRLRPDVVAFDVNETLLDLAPVRAALVEAGRPESLLATVFARTLLTGIAAGATGNWCRFRDAFDAALAQESALDVVPARMALVAAHGWDVLGAQRAGLTGAWFPRSERVYPAVYEGPHVTAPDLGGAVDALLALPSGT
jgi:hypothetical protein